MMPCPRCRVVLRGVRTPVGVAWDCPHDHGRFAMLSVMRGLVDPAAVRTAWRATIGAAPAAGAACPGCTRPMTEVVVDGVTVDLCRSCQAVWFDRGEQAALPPAPPPPDPYAGMSMEARRVLAEAQVRAQQERADNAAGRQRAAPEEWWKRAAGVLRLPVEIGAPALRRAPLATWSLCAVLVVLGVLLLATGAVDAAARRFGFVPDAAWAWGGLTSVTAFFIHGSWLHLLGNVWFLWLTGDNVEDALGRVRFLLLLLVATVAGAVAHALGDPRGAVPCIGASGGISGVLLAYAILFPQARIGLAWFYGLYWLRVPAWLWIAAWVLGQGLLALMQVDGFSRVSAFAHLGGAAAGVVMTWWWRPGRTSGRI